MLATTNDLKPKKTYQHAEKWIGFAEVATFCHVTLGILPDFYYKLIEIGDKPAFSIWYRA